MAKKNKSNIEESSFVPSGAPVDDIPVSDIVSGDGEEVTKYYVTYNYTNIEDNAVLATLPNDDTGYDDGTTVTAMNPTETSVNGTSEGKNGTWTFVGWDETTKTINGANVTFTGTWTFTESSVDPTPDPEPEPDDPDKEDEDDEFVYRWTTRVIEDPNLLKALYGRENTNENIGKVVTINNGAKNPITGEDFPEYLKDLPLTVIDALVVESEEEPDEGEEPAEATTYVLLSGRGCRAGASILYFVNLSDTTEVE